MSTDEKEEERESVNNNQPNRRFFGGSNTQHKFTQDPQDSIITRSRRKRARVPRNIAAGSERL